MRERQARDRRYDRLHATIHTYRAALVLAAVVILILAAILLAGRGHFARAIKINGEIALLVPSKAAADQVRNQLLKEGKGELPGQASFDEQWENVSWPVEGREVLSVSEAMAKLRPKMTVLVSAAAIEVDGQEVVFLATQELAEQALEMVKSNYVEENDNLLEPQKFRQDVRIAQVSRLAGKILTDLSMAAERLTATRTKAETYVVKSGDWPAKIARKHGMSLSELKALNPGVTSRILYPREKLKVSAPAGSLTVVTVKEQTRFKELPPETQEIHTPTLSSGEKQVVREGQPGKKKVWTRVVYENNRVISKKDIKGRIIEEPQPRKVMIGIGEPELSTAESED